MYFFCIARLDNLSQKKSRKCSRISESLEMKIALRKLIILLSRIFFKILVSKMGIKMNLRIIMKNYAADPNIEFPKNRFFLSHPTARELIKRRGTKSQYFLN